MQNAGIGMSKAQYYEMCETLGTEPLDSEIPVELDDLPFEVQSAFEVYRMLKDEWDVVGGNYLGKTLIGITEIFDMVEVPREDRRVLLSIIKNIDHIRQELSAKKASQ